MGSAASFYSGVMKRLAGCIGGALLTSAVGWALFALPFGQEFSKRSYDLPFAVRGAIATPEIVVVFIDAASQAKYQLPSGVIDRRAHVQLLERLTRERARLVFYDVVFHAEMPEVDPQFAKAIRGHGNVLLGYFDSVSIRATESSRTFVQEPVRSNSTLREAAQHTGLLMVQQPDEKHAVREIFTGDADHEAAVWAAARELDGNHMIGTPRLEQRWLNFYGQPPAFPYVSLASVLAPNDVPSGFFRDKIVMIGAHPDINKRERFATPWQRYGTMAGGVEILATSLGNLIQRNWLRRVEPTVQLAVIIGLGLILGAGLALLRPWPATGAAFGVITLVMLSGVYLQFEKNLWWSWTIPVGAQAPVALVWSVGYQYLVASRRERQMKKAFSSYLSPHLVKRIAASDFDLSLGGKEVEATILFTDLEGFTPMSESLAPAEVSRILTGYFEQITTHILKHEGTIIKYVGDAVMAVWGAPLRDARQAERAVLSARGIVEASQQQTFSGRRLRTRIGINSGKALAGNLGSSFRFDYTVIGATTNLANRLEGLNKLLGTDILIADSTRQLLPKEIRTRNLGRFILRGTSEPVRVHEVLATDAEPDWLRLFDEALETRDGGLLQKVVALRGGRDGPSGFYLKVIESGTAKRGEPIKVS